MPLRNTGAALSPFNAFQILQGIETLALRMDRINDNSLRRWPSTCRSHAKVRWVSYAGLPDQPGPSRWRSASWAVAPPSILTFGVEGGREAGARFHGRAAALITRLVNIGDAKSAGLRTRPRLRTVSSIPRS
ncbi:MAG: PLP-dependent transferase [Halofilum sp. (in: g-proteobacteria)]|nr:PLP-dependent transferase [Halofilum sp. (in: g-proteobacteria)]